MKKYTDHEITAEELLTHKSKDKQYIVETSDLGYTREKWFVTTNCPIGKFGEIDLKYGMKYRHQSTTIQQLAEGAVKEGYRFEYRKATRALSEMPADYKARYGNY